MLFMGLILSILFTLIVAYLIKFYWNVNQSQHIENLIIPDIPVRKCEAHKHTDQVKQAIKTWLSDHFNFEWEDHSNLIDHTTYGYACAPNWQKLLLVTKWNVVAFMIDDQLDRNPQLVSLYINLLQEKVDENEKSILYLAIKEVYNQFKRQMSDNLYKLLLSESIKLFSALNTVADINAKKLNLSVEEFCKLRRIDSGCELFVVFTLFLYDVSENILELDCVRQFNQLYMDHAFMVNDLYSFRREYSRDTISFNYVNIVRVQNNISLQKSLDLVAKQIIDKWKQMERSKRDIISKHSGIEVPVNYLNAKILLCEANLDWSKRCKRYNYF